MIRRLIAGPCQAEDYDLSYQIAKHMKDICDKYSIEYYFKASFDKANRSHIDGKRGPGLYETLRQFKKLKKDIPNLKICTDIHESWQAKEVCGFVDIIQIPAFLCRQTDLIQAACDIGVIVNIKKGQFLSPTDVPNILSKTRGEVWITERGTCFGYNNLVVDFNGMQWMLKNVKAPLVFDVTHSTQKPGGNGQSSGGNREYTPGLFKAAHAIGVENFFLEVHPDPDNAPSDGQNMMYLKDVEPLLNNLQGQLPWPMRSNFWID